MVRIVDKMRPNVCGIGFIGEGQYSSIDPAYRVWRAMLQRCYAPDSENMAYAYAESVVCDSWHNFQNFAAWYHAQPPVAEEWTRFIAFDVDKDLTVFGSVEYSPAKCALIPHAINALYVTSKKRGGTLPQGLQYIDGAYAVKCGLLNKQTYVGRYATIAEAQYHYWLAKFDAIRRTTLHYREYLPTALFNKLMLFGWKDVNEVIHYDA